MSTFTVVTYGAGEILSTTFNAIAAVINSQTGTLYQPLVRFALIIGLVWATAAMVYGDKAKFIHNWLIPFYLALSLFFAPTCKVYIKDPVIFSGAERSVGARHGGGHGQSDRRHCHPRD